jgi:hypothetical protein
MMMAKALRSGASFPFLKVFAEENKTFDQVFDHVKPWKQGV